jgi:hypothetical protein
MKNPIYKITITNWKKYNSNRKKSFRSVMIDERFLDDPKIEKLTPGGVLLFLSCLLAASQSESGQIQVSTKLMSFQSRLKPHLIPSQLQTLQSLQLVSYEKIDLLLNRNEMNRNEDNENTPLPPEVIFQETEIQESPKHRISSAQRQELSCSPLYQELTSLLADMKIYSPKLNRSLPEIVRQFETPEKFNHWFTGVKRQKKWKDLRDRVDSNASPEILADLTNYFTGALLNETGLKAPPQEKQFRGEL